jgi:hypothetical protein
MAIQAQARHDFIISRGIHKSLAIRRPVANSQMRWRFEASRVFDENIALFEERYMRIVARCK